MPSACPDLICRLHSVPSQAHPRPKDQVAKRESARNENDVVHVLEKLSAVADGKTPLAIALGRLGRLKDGKTGSGMMKAEPLRNSTLQAAGGRGKKRQTF